MEETSKNNETAQLGIGAVTSSVFTLEHLSAAMANGFLFQYFDDERELLHNDCKIVELREEEMTIANGEYQYDVKFDDVKIIVRPKSDLTNEIDINGNLFVPINYNAFKHSKEDIIEFQNNFIHYKGVKFGIIERFLEWNFDVFNHIKEGRGISIHDVV